MGWFNRLCIRQLRKTEHIVVQRLRHAEDAADRGFADWELFAERMRERLAQVRQQIADRSAAEMKS